MQTDAQANAKAVWPCVLMTLTVETVAVATHAVKAWPPLWPSDETLLVRGHLSRWAQLQARVSGGPFARGCSTG